MCSVLLLLIFIFSSNNITASFIRFNVDYLAPDTTKQTPNSNARLNDSILRIGVLNSDGRFTLGVKNKRIMYGYPYPFSTSHFVIKVNDEFACNFRGIGTHPIYNSIYTQTEKKRPFIDFFEEVYYRFLKRETEVLSQKKENLEKVYLLQDTLFISGFKSMSTEISYKFKGFLIAQKLTPVDKNLNEVKLTSFGQYYRIDYFIKNTADTAQKIGLLVLFDTMIDRNDACKMDAFSEDEPQKMFDGLFGKVPKQIIKKRGLEIQYTEKDMPKRILLYKDARKQTNDFTGDFYISKKDATPPSLLCVGPWAKYYSVLWNVKPTQKGKYKDSAVLMRWDEKYLKPDSVVRYSTYYGLFNPGELEVVVSNLAKLAEFKVSQKKIKRGQKSLLTWKAKLPPKSIIKIGYILKGTKSEKQKVKYLGGNIKNIDSVYVSPSFDRTYVMEIYSNRKLVGTLSADVTVEVEEKENDGRFTIGTKNENTLLFGYPYPYPASQFIFTAEGKYASNNNNLSDTIQYLTGKNSIGANANGNQYLETTYRFRDVILKQKLIPTGAKQNEISLNPSEFWINNNALLIPVDNSRNPLIVPKRTFFKIEYEIINSTKLEKKHVGFSLLLDIMSLDKDDVSLFSEKQKILLVSKFLGKEIPSVICDTIDKNASFILRFLKNSASPDEINLGFFEYLNLILYNTSTKPKDYGEDVALLLKWNTVDLKAENNRMMSFYIGNTNDTIDVKYNDLIVAKSKSIYFATGKDETQNNEMNKIIKFVKSIPSECILIEGFCDNLGDEKANYFLAKKRANEVRLNLIKSGINNKKILVKVSGEINADKNRVENAGDRRVDVSLLIKKK